MRNKEIAKQFSLLAELLELGGENDFRARSYANAAIAIERIHTPLAEMTNEEMLRQPGIGKSIAEKIVELLATGTLEQLSDAAAALPHGLPELLRIKGLGPKKLRMLWQETGIATLEDLSLACSTGQLATIKGFGVKTQDAIQKQVAFIQESKGKYLWAEAAPLAEPLMAQLRNVFKEAAFEITGSLRAQNPVVDAIDICCTLEQEDLLRGYEHLEDVRLITSPSNQLTIFLPQHPALRFHFCQQKDFARRLFETTGSSSFQQAFSARYVFPEDTASEGEIFSENDLEFIPPPLREDPAILSRAAARALPELITEQDIRGIIHCHSDWSDGVNTIEDLARSAQMAGYEYLVLSDHSQAAFYANGLDASRVRAQHLEIERLNEKLSPFRIFKSIECDILNDGNLDFPPDILDCFDLVIASVHSNLGMDEDKAMKRLKKSVENPYLTILGHPSGRLLLKRQGYPLDYETLLGWCKDHDVVVEINANPKRLDLDWHWVGMAQEKGLLLSINPDAHSISGFGDLRYGVLAAQKGGLSAKNNLSSMPLAEFERFILQSRKKPRS